MKKILFLLLFAAASVAASAQVQFVGGSTDAVRDQAVKSGKLVFIDLYATWCPPCRLMNKAVFSRDDVGEFLSERFVSAKYDIEEPTGKALLARYGSGAIPLYLVFTTEGELLGKIQGAAAADEFMEALRKIAARQHEPGTEPRPKAESPFEPVKAAKTK